ncbi:response regulator transcription factor [Marinobacter sp. UBA2688]|uniref:response regulator transcription factor n=1 Tax=Marinobacter sp. UBA2688 TaxID=1946816 RepID=UPI00257B096E|nr:response regulator [Marinobacter sp. UBA2688]|tara:strand:+ start:11568 stop:12182 length:615 start_codon:yes stop_codon:yes gene_type:complete
MNDAYTVYIVDDDISMREAISNLLRSHGFQVVSCESAEVFLEQVVFETPCCVVLDVSMPEMTGVELQDYLIAIEEAIPIVFVTAHGDIPMSVKAIKSGAVEFLQKPVNREHLLEAVKQGLERDTKRHDELSRVAGLRDRVNLLTPRELEILKEAVTGRLNKQIAADLGVAEVTVKVHRHNMMQKLGVRSLADLVRIFERHADLF